ncbi:MAG: hypothetical protein K2L59_04745 [Muribaculaceae bacterium]|nr:hypothetical protein [Muribaculaceae bacterium]
MDKNISALILAVSACAGTACAQTADELLAEGREAFLDYRFDDASRLYAQAKKKAKRTDEFFADKYDSFRRQLDDAENFLGRVEKIAVIDSITVPRQDFFRAYRLPASAGSLRGAEALPGRREDFDPAVDYVFSSERDDYKLWAQPDTTGYMHLVESNLLTDGSWSTPSPLSDELSEDCDAIFPFMMADGVTLYYAENGENSIGGYDIMVATRDAADGSFLQPSNLGFPYNSPFDDYLLAIDELNGVGWWATDRNRLDDELTVYVFVTNDLRTNYPPDEDDITGFARIDDYLATQPEDSDYDSLLATIRAIDPEARVKKPEFTFPASDGRIFHRYDELPDAASRAAMKRWLSAKAELDEALAGLSELRRQYNGNRSASLASRIRREESQTEAARTEVSRLRSDVHKALSKSR